MPVREAVFAAQERTPLAEAPGRIAGAPMGVYPPGIALAMPGERITRALADYLTEEAKAGAALFGVRDGEVSCVHA